MKRALLHLLLIAFVLTGCQVGDQHALDELAKCANIHFSVPPHLVAQHYGADFAGGQTVSAIVDTGQDQVGQFEQLSGLGQFRPGVPPEWQQEHWMDAAVTETLKSGTGNTQYYDYHPSFPARWIVIHDNGNGQRRIFIRAYCEGDAR